MCRQRACTSVFCGRARADTKGDSRPKRSSDFKEFYWSFVAAMKVLNLGPEVGDGLAAHRIKRTHAFPPRAPARGSSPERKPTAYGSFRDIQLGAEFANATLRAACCQHSGKKNEAGRMWAPPCKTHRVRPNTATASLLGAAQAEKTVPSWRLLAARTTFTAIGRGMEFTATSRTILFPSPGSNLQINFYGQLKKACRSEVNNCRDGGATPT